MKRIGIAATVLLAGVLGLAGCEEPAGVPAGYIGADEAGRIVVRFGADPFRYPRDAWALDSARIENDTLWLRIRHGGGCERHRYALIAWNGWLESNPVQAGVLLAHDAGNDPCDALLSPVLRFDLAALREAYRRDYGGAHGTVVLRINDPANPAAVLRMLTWTF